MGYCNISADDGYPIKKSAKTAKELLKDAMIINMCYNSTEPGIGLKLKQAGEADRKRLLLPVYFMRVFLREELPVRPGRS